VRKACRKPPDRRQALGSTGAVPLQRKPLAGLVQRLDQPIKFLLALVKTGAIGHLSALLQVGIDKSPTQAAWGAGIVTSIADKVANNLPVGLVAGSVAASDHLPTRVVTAMLIGVDLGPNLSVSGSLATILWLVALRRERIDVTAWRFLQVGVLVMPPALFAALAAAIL
jgi:arsenical pump membrane protein